MKRTCAVLLILFALGCKTTPPPPPAASAAPRAIEAPAPVVDAGDLTAVSGRTICLDPGHGGSWSGAVAPSNGLREADVNLRVALTVKTLLEGAGARVIMTRVNDQALAPDALGDDLAARADVANRNRVDAFISVHHNADIETGSEKNDLEVYYKLREEGASLDLAQALMRSLSRTLGATATARRLLPGNYKVLRLADVPAVLLESSYLTQAANATNLATDRTVGEEAKAIAQGLASYFALDPPLLASAECVPVDGGRTHALHVRLARGLPVDMGTVDVELDGVPAPGAAEAAEAGFVWTFARVLGNGRHHALVRLRNGRGAGLEFPVVFTINRPADLVTIGQQPAAFAPGGSFTALLEARVYDTLGLPVADGTPVALRELSLSAATHQGVARFYLSRTGEARLYTLASGAASAQYALRANDERYRSIRVKDGVSQSPLAAAKVATGGKTLGSTTPEGWFAIPITVNTVAVRCPGYEPALVSLSASDTEIPLAPRAGGALFGKVLVLDPACGGREPGAVSPDGMRASDYTLDVARRLALQLREAGAEVCLTRDGDVETPDPQRVLTAEMAGADIMVSISFGSNVANAKMLDSSGHRRDDLHAFIGHYPNSGDGTRLAQAIGEALGGISPAPSVAYVVQQTGCPTVLVQPVSIADDDNAARYRSPEARQGVAWGIYQGIVSYYEAKGAPQK